MCLFAFFPGLPAAPPRDGAAKPPAEEGGRGEGQDRKSDDDCPNFSKSKTEEARSFPPFFVQQNEVYYVDRDRAAAVVIGNKDIKKDLRVRETDGWGKQPINCRLFLDSYDVKHSNHNKKQMCYRLKKFFCFFEGNIQVLMVFFKKKKKNNFMKPAAQEGPRPHGERQLRRRRRNVRGGGLRDAPAAGGARAQGRGSEVFLNYENAILYSVFCGESCFTYMHTGGRCGTWPRPATARLRTTRSPSCWGEIIVFQSCMHTALLFFGFQSWLSETVFMGWSILHLLLELFHEWGGIPVEVVPSGRSSPPVSSYSQFWTSHSKKTRKPRHKRQALKNGKMKWNILWCVSSCIIYNLTRPLRPVRQSRAAAVVRVGSEGFLPSSLSCRDPARASLAARGRGDEDSPPRQRPLL